MDESGKLVAVIGDEVFIYQLKSSSLPFLLKNLF